jgi:hypothetical protein
MMRFAAKYKNIKYMQEVLTLISIYNNITLLEKLKDNDKRTRYVNI